MGVPNQKLEAMAQNGVIDRIQDLGGGEYTTFFTAPDEAAKEHHH